MKINYVDIPGFEDLYLEDSYVLEIIENSSEVIFEMEFVLLENHPRFDAPQKGESHCFVNGTFTFGKVKEITWKKRTANKFKDANQEIDLGNIDVFFELDDKYHLEGDWGEIEISADSLIVDFA